MGWRGVLGGALIAAYAGLTAVLNRFTGSTNVLLAMIAGGCLGFGLWFAMKDVRRQP